MAASDPPVKHRKSTRSVKPKTDPNFLYNFALPTYTPENKELEATPKLAEFFSRNPKKGNAQKPGTKATNPDTQKEVCEEEAEGWLLLTLFHMGEGADSTCIQIVFFMTSVRDAAELRNVVTFPKI